jgi:radical SAM superfamily enzyme YgiQ (UPF0313 family)
MKILLVAPPWLDIYGSYRSAAKLGCVSPPLGLAYLGGAILESGEECRIVDMESQGVSSEDLIAIIRDYEPDIVGLTATTPVYENAKLLGGLIRKQFPGLPLGIGGAHSTVVGKTVLEECPCFDFQVCGEGERSILEIIKAVSSGASFAGIEGVIYRVNGGVAENPRRTLIENLDELPFPARHLLDSSLYRHSLPGKGFARYGTVFTSRGCPFQCVFCSQHTMFGRKMRWHGIPRVIEELKQMIDGLGISHIIVMDETLTLNKKRTLELCEAIKAEGLNFTWEGWTHASAVDEELLLAMKAAGLIRLSFGIESGDPEILKRIKKNVTLEQILRAYKIAAAAGIETRGSAMLGHPFETRKTAWRTIRFARGIKECLQLYLNVACPYPGTELYDCAVSGVGGMRLLTNDYSRYKRYGDPVIEVNDLSSRDLKRLQTIGLLYFYLTPRRLWYNVFKRAGLKAGIVNSLAVMRGTFNALRRKKE